MLHTVDGLGGTDTVGVVGVGIAVKGLELPTLFPCQSMAQITGGVTLCVIGNGFVADGGQFILPNIVVGIHLAVLGQDVAVIVIGHPVDHSAVVGFGQQLAQRVVGVLGSAEVSLAITLSDLGDPLLGIVLIGQGTSIGQDDLTDQIGGGGRLHAVVHGMLARRLAGVVQELAGHMTHAQLQLVKHLPAEGIGLRMAGDTPDIAELELCHRVAVLGMLIKGIKVAAGRHSALADQVALLIVVVPQAVGKGLGGDDAAVVKGDIALLRPDDAALFVNITILLQGKNVNFKKNSRTPKGTAAVLL